MATYSQQRNTQRRNTCDHVQATWKHPPVITYNQRWNNCDHVQKETLVATQNQQWNTCDYMQSTEEHMWPRTVNRGTPVATYKRKHLWPRTINSGTPVTTYNQQRKERPGRPYHTQHQTDSNRWSTYKKVNLVQQNILFGDT